MNVCVTADWHGHLPKIPKCDLLVIAGDVFPDRHQEPFCNELGRYLERVPARSIVAVPGNHDCLAAQDPLLMKSLPWTYLCNEAAVVQNRKVWGSGHTSSFGSFVVSEAELAKEIWPLIPQDVEILVTHSAPYGRGDRVYNEHIGSRSLRARVDELTQLRLHAFGHVHESARETGELPSGGRWINASMADAAERPVNPMIAIRI